MMVAVAVATGGVGVSRASRVSIGINVGVGKSGVTVSAISVGGDATVDSMAVKLQDDNPRIRMGIKIRNKHLVFIFIEMIILIH